MTTEEWNTLRNQLIKVIERFADSIRQVGDVLTETFRSISVVRKNTTKENVIYVLV